MRGLQNFEFLHIIVPPWLEGLTPSGFSFECARNLHIKGAPFGVISGLLRGFLNYNSFGGGSNVEGVTDSQCR
jgi:hypothetical protein